MGKICQIFTELWPLTDVQNCVLLNIFRINEWIVIEFCVCAWKPWIVTFSIFSSPEPLGSQGELIGWP